MVSQAFLDLDVGNTSIGWQLVLDGQVSHQSHTPTLEGLPAPAELLASADRVGVRLAKVGGGRIKPLLAAYREVGIDVWRAETQRQAGGLSVAYDDPSKLGVDRWLVMLALVNRGQYGVIVDIGTALTLDVVSADGKHLGGYILPGPELMLNSLHDYAAKLPSVAVIDMPESTQLGRDTEACMTNGVYAAITGVIQQFLTANEMPLWLCGGYSGQWRSQFPSARFEAGLVFEGLEVAWQLANIELEKQK